MRICVRTPSCGRASRAQVKQTVMTSVYGVTFIGARLQVPHCPPCSSPTPAPTLTTTRPEVLLGTCAAPGGRMDYTSQCLWH